MSNLPANLKYTKEHEWLQPMTATQFRIGITDFAQSALGDIVFIALPKVGSSFQAGSVCGEVESTKSVSEIFTPLSCKITAVNTTLESNPELINQDPYGAGWIAEIEIEDGARSNSEISGLLSDIEYKNLTA